MSRKHSHSSDIRGLSHLMMDALIGITGLVEEFNLHILNTTKNFAIPVHSPLTRATAGVYSRIRNTMKIAGSGIDTVLDWMTPLLINNQGWKGRESVVSALNGVLGDYLLATENPLAVEMEFRYRGKSLEVGLEPSQEVIRQVIPDANGRIVVLVHGLCMSDLLWDRNNHDHGLALEADCGLTPVYLRYNSGLHISRNGRQLALQLETLVSNWPVPVQEISFLGHSMGGMLVRSAFYYGKRAGCTWPDHVVKMIFLGTPHHGAPLERGGTWFHMVIENNVFLAPFSSLGRIRSAGITDLRYGNLLDTDWEGVDRFKHVHDLRSAVPLPKGIECYALAATIGKRASAVQDRLLGDGLVPVNSALGVAENPAMNLRFKPKNRVVLRGMNHLDLLDHEKAYQQIRIWLQKDTEVSRGGA